jgi:hypothetical protein
MNDKIQITEVGCDNENPASPRRKLLHTQVFGTVKYYYLLDLMLILWLWCCNLREL